MSSKQTFFHIIQLKMQLEIESEKYMYNKKFSKHGFELLVEEHGNHCTVEDFFTK